MGLPTSKRKRHAPPNNCRYRKLTKRTVVAASGENQIFMNISNEGNDGSLYKLWLFYILNRIAKDKTRDYPLGHLLDKLHKKWPHCCRLSYAFISYKLVSMQ